MKPRSKHHHILTSSFFASDVFPGRAMARRTIAAVAITMLIAGCAGSQTIDGEISGDSFPVYLYKPDRPGAYPGLLVLHTVGGLQPHVHDYAAAIADHGFVALVVDYKSGSPARLGNRYRIYDAYRYLSGLPEVDADRIGIAGFSLGPRHALSIAANDPAPRLSTGEPVDVKIKAIVSYYVGRLHLAMYTTTGFEAVLFLHGDQDVETAVTYVELFCERVTSSGRVCEKEIYPGARHAFDHTSRYGGYDPDVTARAFTRSVRFLESYLK